MDPYVAATADSIRKKVFKLSALVEARRVRDGLSHKGFKGVQMVSERLVQELNKTSNPEERMRDAGIESGEATELGRDYRVHDAIASELDLIERRLIGNHPALYSEADRLRAEHEFRLAIVPPLIAIVLVLTFQESAAWLLALIPIGLLYIQGLLRREARNDLLVDLLLLGTVKSPTEERLLPEEHKEAGAARDEPVPAT